MTSLRKRFARDESGFTLIELLVVIIIIGILLAIAVPSYLGFRDRAQKSAAQSNVRAIVPSIEAYYSDNNDYDGMSLTALKTGYDQSIDNSTTTGYKLTESDTSYCVSFTEGDWTAKKAGPSADTTLAKTSDAGATC